MRKHVFDMHLSFCKYCVLVIRLVKYTYIRSNLYCDLAKYLLDGTSINGDAI